MASPAVPLIQRDWPYPECSRGKCTVISSGTRPGMSQQTYNPSEERTILSPFLKTQAIMHWSVVDWQHRIRNGSNVL